MKMIIILYYSSFFFLFLLYFTFYIKCTWLQVEMMDYLIKKKKKHFIAKIYIDISKKAEKYWDLKKKKIKKTFSQP